MRYTKEKLMQLMALKTTGKYNNRTGEFEK